MKLLTDKLVSILILLVCLPFFFIYVVFAYTRHLLFEQKTLPTSLKMKILHLRPGDEIVYNGIATKITNRTEIGFSLHFGDLILSEDGGAFSLSQKVANIEDPERVKPYIRRAWKIDERRGQIAITVK